MVYWFFNHGFKFSNVVCNGWHDLPMLCLNIHCVKSVQIRSLFWSVISRIWNEYGDLPSKFRYSVRIRGNTDQKNLRIWTLFTQWQMILVLSLLKIVIIVVFYIVLTNLKQLIYLKIMCLMIIGIYKMHINIIKNRVHNRFGDLKKPRKTKNKKYFNR